MNKRKQATNVQGKYTQINDNFVETLSVMTSSDGFEKKIVKLFKALRLMEQAKHLEPKFSDSFSELARIMNEQRKSSDTVSRLSSMGGFGDSGLTTFFGPQKSTNSLPPNPYRASKSRDAHRIGRTEIQEKRLQFSEIPIKDENGKSMSPNRGQEMPYANNLPEVLKETEE